MYIYNICIYIYIINYVYNIFVLYIYILCICIFNICIYRDIPNLVWRSHLSFRTLSPHCPLRRRLQKEPLTIRMKLPGGAYRIKVLGGGSLDQNILDRVAARLLGPIEPFNGLLIMFMI